MTADAPGPTADDTASRFGLTWYHHALVLAYSVSAAVSAPSMPLPRLALEFVGSLLGAYIVIIVLTLLWRRAVPRLL